MRINPAGNINNISGGYRPGKTEAYGKSAEGLGQDEATLSGDAISFSRAFSEVRDSAAARGGGEPDRIADIKARIENGTYSVSSEDVAGSMLDVLS